MIKEGIIRLPKISRAEAIVWTIKYFNIASLLVSLKHIRQ